MGFVADATSTKQRVSPRAPALGAIGAYAIFVGMTALLHEPWADEAHSWLLGRDASLFELWTRLLHYEGTPGLWQTLLHILQRAGLPYAGLNVFSGLLGLAATALLIMFAPFPLAMRLVLPFTYYLFYQYAVVARSYALLPVLLFGCAMLFGKVERKIWLFTALVCLMAAVSIHGLALSVAIWVAAHIALSARWKNVDGAQKRHIFIGAVAYSATLALVVAFAWPAKDVTFVRHLNISFVHFLITSKDSFSEAFTGEWISSLAAVAISIPFLWRNKALPVLVLAAGMLCIVNGVIYSQVWHRGLLFLAWLFAMWIAANTAKLTWLAASALVAVIALHASWTVATVAYDWRYAYSGAKEAAQYIHAMHLEKTRIYAVGYACTAVQPYFPANIFSNLNEGRRAAFWDWSSRNHSIADLSQVAQLRPDYVLVGYTGTAEKMIWNDEVQRSGYSLIRHFDGNLFWRTGILEPDAFDLYRRQ